MAEVFQEEIELKKFEVKIVETTISERTESVLSTNGTEAIRMAKDRMNNCVQYSQPVKNVKTKITAKEV